MNCLNCICLEDEWNFWVPEQDLVLFPEPDPLYYEKISWGRKTRRERLKILAGLSSSLIPGHAPSESPSLIVAPVRAVFTRTLPRREFIKSSRVIRKSGIHAPQVLAMEWVRCGYEVSPIVTSPGQFARRGGILDVWPPGDRFPARIEFFGDEVEMLRRFDPATDRDVVFIPVGINYDRTLEDRSLLRTFDPAAEKRSWWFVCRTTFKFIRHSLGLMILSRWRRYGYACVNFGTPLSAKAYCLDQGINFSRLPRADRFPEIEKLCHRLMSAISEVVPVLPVSLMSTVFLEAMDTELDILDIEERSNRLINELQARGAPVFEMSRSTRAHDIVDAIDLMTLRRMVTASGDQFKAVSEEEAIMCYYANTIDHWRTHE